VNGKRKNGSRTYTVVDVAVQEHLTASLAANKGRNLGKLARLALPLDLQRLLRHLVLEQSGGVLPPSQNKVGVVLVRRHNGLLDLLMDGRLNSAHEPRTHVDTFRTERQRRRKTLSVSEPTRRDEGDVELLARPAQENEVCDVVLADVAGALEAVDGEEVHAQLHGGLGVPDGRALVQDDRVGLLQLRDHGAGVVAGCLDDLDALVDDYLCVGGVVWGHEGWEEGQVHAEGVLGHGSASANLFAEVFGGGLRECSELVRLAIVFQDVEIVDVQFPALLRC
jgi:hypothetical protein